MFPLPGGPVGFAWRMARRTREIDGYDRALALACQGFVALIPMVAGLTTVLGGQGGSAAVAADLGLSADLIDSMSALGADAAPDTDLTVVGICLLVVSVLGFIRTLQRTYTATWSLTTTGVRAFGRSLLASTVLVAEFGLLVLVAPVLGWFFDSLVIGLAAHAATALLLWWPIQRVLVSGRVGWMRLLPGALVAGLGQALLVTASGLYMPFAVTRAAERLGLLGVAIVLLSWLILLGLLLVLSAVAGAELARLPDSSAEEDARTPGTGDADAVVHAEEGR